MQVSLAAFVLAVLVLRSSGLPKAHQLENEYRFSANLDREGKYNLFWNFDLVKEEISFAVRVTTSGWVGFGLSPNGQMPGSDVVIGWVQSNEDVVFHVSGLAQLFIYKDSYVVLFMRYLYKLKYI